MLDSGRYGVGHGESIRDIRNAAQQKRNIPGFSKATPDTTLSELDVRLSKVSELKISLDIHGDNDVDFTACSHSRFAGPHQPKIEDELSTESDI
jgi:hypothetical protein